MIVENKNIGKKIDYTVQGTVISFNEEITLDLSKYERDFPVHLDLSKNEHDMLILDANRQYVAEIDIPARVYEEDLDEEENIYQLPVSLDMSTVKLTLWSLEV
jgi:hypothetical protein